MMDGIGLVDRLVEWIEYGKIFCRERTTNYIRAMGMLLYHSGLSYEKASEFLGVSHEAVREWYQKGKVLFEQTVEKKKRKRIAVDEKEIKVNGTTIYIWGAVDLENEEVIAVATSFGRSGLEAFAFMKKVRNTCKGRLPVVFVDGGTWYPWAFGRLGFNRYVVVHFGPRSAIERLFGGIEWRIRRFWNKFCGHQSRGSVQRWVEAFVGFRNYRKDIMGALS